VPATAPTGLGRTTRLAIVSFTTLCGSVSLIYPFGRDQGNYAYAGWVLLDGGAPYRDVFMFKPPMTAAVHAAALGLFGVNTWAIRVLDIGWSALTALAIAAIALELWQRRDVALASALTWPFLYYQIDYWNIAQTDGWMTLPSALAIWAVLRGGRAWVRSEWTAMAWWTAAGAFAGIAVLFKYTAGAIAGPMLAALAFVAVTRGRRVWSGLPLMLLGGAAILAACWGWLAATGAWDAFVETQLSLVAPYVVQRAKADTLGQTLTQLVRLRAFQQDLLPLLWTGPIALIPALIASAGGERAAWWALTIPLTWWLAAVVNVLVQGKFFDYHYLPIIAPSALLAGFGLGTALRKPFSRLRSGAARAGVTATLALVLIIATPIGGRARDAARVLTGSQTIETYIASRREYSLPSYRVEEIHRLSKVLMETTTPEQRVFVWGFHPTINIRARRRTVSRFLYNTPFRGSEHRARYEAELMDALTAHPPEVIVVASGDRHFGLDRSYVDSASLLLEVPGLEPFILDHYRRDEPIGRFSIYRLGPGSSQ
jgi:hypothetical protein